MAGALRRLQSRLTSGIFNDAQLRRGVESALIRQTKKQFRNETNSSGEKWKRLSPEYLAIKRGKGILRETDNLYRSLTRRRHKNHISSGRGNRYEFGTDVEYAAEVYEDREFLPEFTREARDAIAKGLVR